MKNKSHFLFFLCLAAVFEVSLFTACEELSINDPDPEDQTMDDSEIFDIAIEPGDSIQAAIDKASSGDIILLRAGIYYETVTLNKQIVLKGEGSGGDGTVITNPNGADITKGVIQLEASGTEEEPILITNLRIEVDGLAGISVGLHNDDSSPGEVEWLHLKNIAVTGNNDAVGEKERGLYVGGTSSLRHLTVEGSSFHDLTYGWYLHMQLGGDGSTVEHVSVSDTSFNHNNIKGIYAEKLSRAAFENCTVHDNGFTKENVPDTRVKWMSGVDINLKHGNYHDISFLNCTVTHNGRGADDDEGYDGAGLTIKARGTGQDSSYNSPVAHLNKVLIDGGRYTDNINGIRFGETGKENQGPKNITVRNASISGNHNRNGFDARQGGDKISSELPF